MIYARFFTPTEMGLAFRLVRVQVRHLVLLAFLTIYPGVFRISRMHIFQPRSLRLLSYINQAIQVAASYRVQNLIEPLPVPFLRIHRLKITVVTTISDLHLVSLRLSLNVLPNKSIDHRFVGNDTPRLSQQASSHTHSACGRNLSYSRPNFSWKKLFVAALLASSYESACA